MKHLVYILLTVAAATATLSSCDSRGKLARELSGSWSGVPERLFDAPASSATILETYNFVPGGDASAPADSGVVIINSMVSVTGAINGIQGISIPVSVTASGFATIRGAFTVTGGDKVELNLDRSTLTVKVDPEAVLLSTDMTEDADNATVMKLRPQLAQSICAQLQKAVGERYGAAMTLDDVSVKDNTLSFKLNKTNYRFSRQTSD